MLQWHNLIAISDWMSNVYVAFPCDRLMWFSPDFRHRSTNRFPLTLVHVRGIYHIHRSLTERMTLSAPMRTEFHVCGRKSCWLSMNWKSLEHCHPSFAFSGRTGRVNYIRLVKWKKTIPFCGVHLQTQKTCSFPKLLIIYFVYIFLDFSRIGYDQLKHMVRAICDIHHNIKNGSNKLCW